MSVTGNKTNQDLFSTNQSEMPSILIISRWGKTIIRGKFLVKFNMEIKRKKMGDRKAEKIEKQMKIENSNPKHLVP